MFEKDAEERAKRLEEEQTLGIYDNDEELARDEGFNRGEVCGYEEGFKDGAEFGYNKANEWHYPSKGEHPKDEFPDEYKKSRLPSVYKRHYCLYLGDNDCVMGKYMKGSFWTLEGQYSLNEIVAWKEIVLPKESE